MNKYEGKVDKSKIPRIVILGADMNAYSVARAYHEYCGGISDLISKRPTQMIYKSKILRFHEHRDLSSQATFVQQLTKYGINEDDALKPLLIGTTDEYVRLIVKNKEELSQMFVVPYAEQSSMDELILKERFYDNCKKYNIPFPDTFKFVYPYEGFYESEFYEQHTYPLILKPSDSVSWYNNKFDGFHKVFTIRSNKEFEETIKAIKQSGYKDTLLIQPKIGFCDSDIYDLHIYVDKNHKCCFMDFGNVILEEHTPTAVGNNACTLSLSTPGFGSISEFLEDIKAEGWYDADIIWDNGAYRFLEINIRQGRSNYRVSSAGNNIVKILIDDYYFNSSLEFFEPKPIIWSSVPISIAKHFNKQLTYDINERVRKFGVSDSLYYKKDMAPKRYIFLKLRALNFFLKFFRQRKKVLTNVENCSKIDTCEA